MLFATSCNKGSAIYYWLCSKTLGATLRRLRRLRTINAQCSPPLLAAVQRASLSDAGRRSAVVVVVVQCAEGFAAAGRSMCMQPLPATYIELGSYTIFQVL